jgi:hypothetical protein
MVDNTNILWLKNNANGTHTLHSAVMLAVFYYTE